MSDVFVGRQPIFDVDRNVVAYELLFRSSQDQLNANVVDGDIATSQVMLNTFFEIGLDILVGDKEAFINMTQYFLEDPDRIAMPPRKVVLEVLEDVEPNEKVIETLKTLKKKGHTIALDDFVFRENLAPLVDLADIVKIDVMSLNKLQIEQLVAKLNNGKIQLLAEKVETEEKFELLKKMDFHYYQGYFFAKPTIVKGNGLKSNQTVVLRLVSKVNNPEIELDELCEVIGTDVSLSYKVLKFINSSASGISIEVDSIQQAVVLLGINTIKNWISIVALATGSDKPQELSTLALVRGRVCEQLAKKSKLPKPDSFFTVGLFSTLDAMMDQPLPILLVDLPLSNDMKAGLLEISGIYGQALGCAIAMERNNFASIRFLDMTVKELFKLYLEAMVWADEQSKSIS